MLSYASAPHVVTRRHRRRAVCFLSLVAILWLLSLGSAALRALIGSKGGFVPPPKAIINAAESARDEYEEYTAVVKSLGKSVAEIERRVESMRSGMRANVPRDVVAQLGEGTLALWGYGAEGDDASLAQHQRPSAVPSAEEREALALADLNEQAAAVIAEVRAQATRAKDVIVNQHVAQAKARRFGDPPNVRRQWSGGGAPAAPQGGAYNRPDNNNRNVPAWGVGEAVDVNDRRDNRVDPYAAAGGNGRGQQQEHVVPRFDRQTAPSRPPANAYPQQEDGNPFMDYDNDFYQGIVDDHPGPPMHIPDPLEELSVSVGMDNDAELNERRAAMVVDAFKHSWEGYKLKAWGCDEVKPRSKECKNWNDKQGPKQGFGLTILDGMTTAHLMGLQDEVEEALSYVQHDLHLRELDVDGSLFETNIRALGGLLSMYELTGEVHRFLLDKAIEVGDILLFAFNTTTGIPHSTVNFRSRRHFSSPWGGGNAVLAEAGTVQLEFRTLSFHSGNPVYDMKATHVTNIIEAKAPADFLCPIYMSHKRMTWSVDHISLGALGDSFYEYIIKQYVLTHNTEERYARLSVKMLKGLSKLLFRSHQSSLLYLAEYRAKSFHHKMDHLACFAGGMFAMMAKELPDLTHDEAEHIMKLAGDLTETCVFMYTRQVTGVSPEFVEFPAGADFVNGQSFYILRPEAIESVFYMWRYTKDDKWRRYGWRMFLAIDKWCKVKGGGYAGIREVNVADPPKDNLMQSFWVAETLKYFYLLFTDDSNLDLNQWVFNTEAHPLRRRRRDPIDVWRQYEMTHGEVPWFPPPLPGVKLTETANMAAMRREGSIKYLEMGKDVLGGDTDEGFPDDEGLPFDERNGPLGIFRDRMSMKDVLIDEGRTFDYSRIRRDGQLVE